MLFGDFPSRQSCSCRVWCLLEFPFGCAACVAGWVDLWCGLKHTTGCVGSGSVWLGFWYRLLPDILSNVLGISVCSYHAVHCFCIYCILVCREGANLCKRVGFLLLRAGGRSIKGQRIIDIHLQLLATLPCTEVAWSSFWAFWKKTIQWPRLTMIQSPLNR